MPEAHFEGPSDGPSNGQTNGQTNGHANGSGTRATTSIPHIRLLGMPIHAVTETQVIEAITSAAGAGVGGTVITPNLDQLRHYHHTPALREMYERASLVLADGMPLVWASRLQKTPLPQRVPGSALILTLSQAAAVKGLSVFLLGGNPGAAEQAAQELQARFPGLRIADTYCPPFGFERDPAEMQRIEQRLAAAKPQIIFVGLGFPKQERLIDQVRSAAPNAWFLGVGISFSFVSGEVRRAPQWMQRAGLEWVHRLVQEPGRLFKRYIIHDIPFAVRLFAGAIAARFSGRAKA
jgi:N-acetylglucosaminyldiphosphoundecaprenol N-acetyl-beta-D-mannosaminyltransferase